MQPWWGVALCCRPAVLRARLLTLSKTLCIQVGLMVMPIKAFFWTRSGHPAMLFSGTGMSTCKISIFVACAQNRKLRWARKP